MLRIELEEFDAVDETGERDACTWAEELRCTWERRRRLRLWLWLWLRLRLWLWLRLRLRLKLKLYMLWVASRQTKAGGHVLTQSA
jgi:hypothetical protein